MRESMGFKRGNRSSVEDFPEYASLEQAALVHVWRWCWGKRRSGDEKDRGTVSG
jgi:hypothetical protein